MRLALLVTLLTLLALAPAHAPPSAASSVEPDRPTWLTVNATQPGAIAAGAELVHPITVELNGSTGRAPGLAGPVNLTVLAPEDANCSFRSDEGTYEADLPPDALPDEPVPHDPLPPGTIPDEPLPSQPDPLGPLPEQPVPHDQLPYEAIPDGPLQPEPLPSEHIPEHPLPEQPPAQGHAPEMVLLDPVAGNATGTLTCGPLQPGMFELAVEARSPPHAPGDWNATVTVTTGDPSGVPGEPGLALTSGSVNDDGKKKHPGQELITRLTATQVDVVDVVVYRRVGDGLVPIDQRTLHVPSSGEVEHRFSHTPLPAGPLVVEATAGQARAVRTAVILDSAPNLGVEAPGELLADGRELSLEIEVLDANFGSTPMDPGPVWGLPEIAWRIFRGSAEVQDWQSLLAGFPGEGNGTAETNLITWPSGEGALAVTPGRAVLPMTIDPPESVAPGDYRVSLYDADGDRLGGASWTLTPPPAISLDPAPPIPGAPWRVNATVDHASQGLEVRLVATVREGATETVLIPEGQPGLHGSLDLPAQLPAGESIQLEAWASWPGRPNTTTPDARLELAVPELPPELAPSVLVDGRPVASPVALHPATDRTLEVFPGASDPNGDPVSVSAVVLDPEGAPVDWPVQTGSPLELGVPVSLPAGGYQLLLTATSTGGTSEASVWLELASHGSPGDGQLPAASDPDGVQPKVRSEPGPPAEPETSTAHTKGDPEAPSSPNATEQASMDAKQAPSTAAQGKDGPAGDRTQGSMRPAGWPSQASETHTSPSAWRAWITPGLAGLAVALGWMLSRRLEPADPQVSESAGGSRSTRSRWEGVQPERWSRHR